MIPGAPKLQPCDSRRYVIFLRPTSVIISKEWIEVQNFIFKECDGDNIFYWRFQYRALLRGGDIPTLLCTGVTEKRDCQELPLLLVPSFVTIPLPLGS